MSAVYIENAWGTVQYDSIIVVIYEEFSRVSVGI